MLHTIEIQRVMSAPAITAKGSETLTAIRKLMKDREINHLPIVDDANMPIGIISALDLMQLSDWRMRFKDLARTGALRDETLFDSLLAEEIMVRPVRSIPLTANIKEAADVIEGQRIHCLPVTNETGSIVGIITAHDLLRLAYQNENPEQV